jgi:hypothetical protein
MGHDVRYLDKLMDGLWIGATVEEATALRGSIGEMVNEIEGFAFYEGQPAHEVNGLASHYSFVFKGGRLSRLAMSVNPYECPGVSTEADAQALAKGMLESLTYVLGDPAEANPSFGLFVWRAPVSGSDAIIQLAAGPFAGDSADYGQASLVTVTVADQKNPYYY